MPILTSIFHHSMVYIYRSVFVLFGPLFSIAWRDFDNMLVPVVCVARKIVRIVDKNDERKEEKKKRDLSFRIYVYT